MVTTSNNGARSLEDLVVSVASYLFLFVNILTENRAKRDVITTLVQRGYPSDPVKAWKELQKSNAPEAADTDIDDASSVASSAGVSPGAPDFNYLLSMSLLSLSREKKEELIKQRDTKVSHV